MKSSEFIRFIKKQGWVAIRQKGSHITFKNKDGIKIVVPFHAHKEIAEPLRLSILKQMGL